MPFNLSPSDFPNLTDENSAVTSPKRNAYNCIAWAVGDTKRWWWPFGAPGMSYWPAGVPREETLEAFIRAFGTCGFRPCDNASLEPGIEKIAIFAGRQNGELIPTHAALQLASGEWTSKLGTLEDIRHTTLEALEGRVYGVAVQFLSKPRPQPPHF